MDGAGRLINSLAITWKFAAILLFGGLGASCFALDSYATAARQLSDGDGSTYYCWRQGLGNTSGSCAKAAPRTDLWLCAHKLATTGKRFQATRISRSEIIACMHEKGWQEFEIVVSG